MRARSRCPRLAGSLDRWTADEREHLRSFRALLLRRATALIQIGSEISSWWFSRPTRRQESLRPERHDGGGRRRARLRFCRSVRNMGSNDRTPRPSRRLRYLGAWYGFDRSTCATQKANGSIGAEVDAGEGASPAMTPPVAPSREERAAFAAVLRRERRLTDRRRGDRDRVPSPRCHRDRQRRRRRPRRETGPVARTSLRKVRDVSRGAAMLQASATAAATSP